MATPIWTFNDSANRETNSFGILIAISRQPVSVFLAFVWVIGFPFNYDGRNTIPGPYRHVFCGPDDEVFANIFLTNATDLTDRNFNSNLAQRVERSGWRNG